MPTVTPLDTVVITSPLTSPETTKPRAVAVRNEFTIFMMRGCSRVLWNGWPAMPQFAAPELLARVLRLHRGDHLAERGVTIGLEERVTVAAVGRPRALADSRQNDNE